MMYRLLLCILCCLVLSAIPALGNPNLEELGQKAVAAAQKALDPHPVDACLTNAATAGLNGSPCTPLLDTFSNLTHVSLGKGSLMPVHERWGEAPWAAFVSRANDDTLDMVLIRMGPAGIDLAGPVNVRVAAGTDFAPFISIFGKQAFSLVTLANGWADGIPVRLMAGALYHDHLCCGVSTGYLISNYILDQFPLSQGQSYLYLGIPAWCQDDLIMTALNVTPGKHGYVTMAYPWGRPWQTKEKSYSNLGGIIIRKDSSGGEARVLSFDWQFAAFKNFAGLSPDAPLDWKATPWLHVLYNRFLASRAYRPAAFVSTVASKRFNTPAQVNELTRLGTNPLTVLLGPDPQWRTTP